jgi:hypothetical protein
MSGPPKARDIGTTVRLASPNIRVVNDVDRSSNDYRGQAVTVNVVDCCNSMLLTVSVC